MLDYRQAVGTVPAGATRARVAIILTTGITNWNGHDSPQAGYGYAAAADIRLTLSEPAPAPPPLTPPAANVPAYQHVFLFYFENEDYSQVIGNTKQVPYLNSLRQRGATLTNFYAEEHPSDANYLAIADGSAFGVPLTDPEEENPLCTIGAANLGDLIADSGESWKAYPQRNSPATWRIPPHLDRYAQPLNSIFNSERTSFSAPSPVNVATRKAGLVAAAITG